MYTWGDHMLYCVLNGLIERLKINYINSHNTLLRLKIGSKMGIMEMRVWF